MSREHTGWLEGAVVDAVVEAYIDWREDAAAVARAHRRWNDAPRDERALAFAALSAALDREERAAGLFQELVTCAERAVGPGGLRLAA
jgi:hypothetical protein